MIQLRAMALVWKDEPDGGIRSTTVQGVALPDGRFLFHGMHSYSSEQVMLKLNPGATVEWFPHVDSIFLVGTPEEET